MDVEKVSKSLNAGALVVMPTDTVYGLCCKASDAMATDKLYRLKSRSQKPGTIIAGSIDQLVELGIKRRYLKAVEQFWPSSVSVVIPVGKELEYLNQGVGSIAVRVTDDKNLINLLSKTGAILTSSANMPGQPVATSISQAKSIFGDVVDMYVDGGDSSERSPSTIIRIVDDAVEVLREGAVKIDEKGRIS